MTFPNAYEGIKKLFTSNILNLISGACMLVAGGLGVLAIAAMASDSEGGLVAGGIGTVILMIAGLVLSIIGCIFRLIGLKRAGIDEPRFQQAFLLAVFSLILTVAATVLTYIAGASIWDDLALVIANVFDMIVTIFVVNGIQILAEQLHDNVMVKRGSNFLVLLCVLYIVVIVARLIPIFFGADAATSVTANSLSLIGAVLSVILYILYLVYLGQAKKMLREK